MSRIIIGLKNGEILVLQLSFDGTRVTSFEVEPVTRFPIRTISLSKDESKLIVISDSDEGPVLRSFDTDALHITKHSLPLITTNINENHVTVGWGSEETQFKSTEERKNEKAGENLSPDSATSTELQKLQNGALNYEVDPNETCFNPKVSWGLESSYFAISINVKEGTNPSSPRATEQAKRCIYIYSNECIPLASVDKSVTGVGHCLEWGSTGLAELIAVDQDLYGKMHISFFEKNGLRHIGFRLKNFNQGVFSVKKILWNCNATILAVWIRNSNNNSDLIHLYTTSNYDWQLKFEIYSLPTERFEMIEWCVDKPMVLYIINNLGIIITYKFVSECLGMDNSQVEFNPAMVCVIDGSEVKFTPFSLCCIPPPYSASLLKIKQGLSILNVSYFIEELLVALITRESIYIARDNAGMHAKAGNKSMVYNEASFEVISIVELPETVKLPIQVTFVDKNSLVFLDCSDGGRCNVYLIKMDKFAFDVKPKLISKIGSLLLPTKLTRVSNSVYAEDGNGCLFSIVVSDDINNCFLNPLDTRFPYFMPMFNFLKRGTTPLHSENEINNNLIFIGLSEDKMLYVNQVLLNSSCTSYNVSNMFISYTTYKNRLVTSFLEFEHVDLELEELDEVEILVGKLKNAETHSRSIERGATIVAFSEENYNLILQMPRGNLECIQPKVFLLHQICVCIDKMNYSDAYMIARKNCIDMNFIIDINPTRFKKMCKEFVTQLNSPKHLNNFILALKEEDVTQTLYDGINCTKKKNVTNPFNNKLNEVCSLLESAINQIDKNKYLTSLISLDLVKKPPQYANTMSRISEVMDSVSDRILSRQLTEDAVNYMVSTEDISYLYNAALGTYNLNLALVMALKSQFDPRDYVPFINSLRALPEYYKRFKIDKHLNFCNKAVSNMIIYLVNDKSADERYYSELRKYISDNKVYLHAFKCLDKLDDPRMQNISKWVCRNYADYLSNNFNYKEAGIFYELSLEKSLAIDMYMKCFFWEKTLQLAQELGKPEEDIKEIAFTLVKDLSEKGRYNEAANICMFYLDKKSAIEYLLNEKKWKLALYLSSSLGLEEDKSSIVIHGIKNAVASCISELKLLVLQINHICESIVEHRTKKDKVLKTDFAYDDLKNDISDNSSDVSNVSFVSSLDSCTTRSTSSTSLSRKSNKSTMKALRKREAGKDPVYREEFLLKNLNKICSKINESSLDAKELMDVCIKYTGYSSYDDLVTAYNSLMEKTTSCLDIIFPPVPPEEPLVFIRPEIIKVDTLSLP